MMENHDKEMENKLIEMIRAKEESDRRMLAFEWVIGILSVILLLIPSCIACLFPMKEWQQILVVFSGLIPALIGFCFAMKIEQIAGYYECRHCKHKYVPEYMAMFPAPHIGRTRFMKCPKCGKRSWQKKVVGKD